MRRVIEIVGVLAYLGGLIGLAATTANYEASVPGYVIALMIAMWGGITMSLAISERGVRAHDTDGSGGTDAAPEREGGGRC